MRTVFSNSQVAHVWAQQRQAEGRGSNFYFRDSTIYSYGGHFPIARFERPDVVLFTTGSYSQSTCKHLNYTRRALHGLPVRVFNVPYVQGTRHADNVADYATRYTAALEKAGRARRYADMHYRDAIALREEHAAYCELFAPDVAPLAEVSPELVREAAERSRERAKRDRVAREERDRAAKIAMSADVAAWRNGERRDLWQWHSCGGETLLRLSRDGSTIQTSRGAEVPVSVAPRLWAIVQAARHGVDVSAAYGRHIGHFTLNRVERTGAVTIGCHTLLYVELSRMADALGFTPREAQQVTA